MFLYFHNIMSGIIVKTKETKPPNTKLELAQRKDDEMRNPCVKESHKSIDCLSMNEDKSLCQLYIENYKTCVKFWNHISKQRRRAGKKPHLPPPDEREQIRAEYFQKYKQT